MKQYLFLTLMICASMAQVSAMVIGDPEWGMITTGTSDNKRQQMMLQVIECMKKQNKYAFNK